MKIHITVLVFAFIAFVGTGNCADNSSTSVLLIDVTPKTMCTARLKKLGFVVEVVDWKKFEPDRLMSNVQVVILPSSWAANEDRYRTLESRSEQFRAFVRRGGALLICQPNYDGDCTPSLLPYPITFRRKYDDSKPMRVKVDADHYITNGLNADELPFPFDPMIKVDPRYSILAKQKSGDIPSLAVCKFGDGRVVVQSANESSIKGPRIPLPDVTLKRMIDWCARKEESVEMRRK